MGGSRTGWIVALALALCGSLGCGSSKSSDGDDSGEGGASGQALGGTSGQGGSGHSSGGASSAGRAGGATGPGGTGASGGGGNGGSGAGGAGARAGTGGGAGDTGGHAAGGTLGDAGAAGESAGASGGGNGGRAGSSASLDCTGTFGEPRVVLGPVVRLFSPTVTADETEVLYAMNVGQDLAFFHSKRSSKSEPFGDGVALPELDAACALTDSRTVDLTSDGLRAYLVCYGPDSPHDYGLRIAARPTLDAPFVLDPAVYGDVGPSAAVAPDELSLYSSAVHIGVDPAPVFERSTTSEPFGSGLPIPGLEDTPLITPDLSADGLSLFGSVDNAIVVATRPTLHAPFSSAQVIIEAPDSGEWLSPTISQDCRSLYAVRQDVSSLTLEVFER